MGIKLGNIDAKYIKVGSDDCKVYLGDTLLYPQSPTPPTPTGSTCYEIIATPITSYSSTTYDSVYSFSDSKWYMLNNLNQYEEYGVYDVVEDIASATTYEGKLGVVGETEYQYSGDSWSVVGSYVDSSVTYTIDSTDPSPYVGQELSTTFKIPYADVQANDGFVDFRITTNDNSILSINLFSDEYADYYYNSSSATYQGTVTNDGEYFYLSLPSEAPQSIVISRVDYYISTPTHIIAGSKQATVEYAEKATPSYAIYDTVAEMEAVGCPNAGINEYAFVGNDLYKYFANEEWDGVSYHNPKMVAFYESGDPLLVYNNGNSTLKESETQRNQKSPISVYIGDNVTSIGEEAFRDCSGLTSIEIPNSVTSIGRSAFNSCSGLTSIDIPNSVTSIGQTAFYVCKGFTSITIPDSVTTIGDSTFGYCSALTSVTCLATTPPTLGTRVFDGSTCPIYVPSASVNAYKTATNWSTYASRIQAIPNS